MSVQYIEKVYNSYSGIYDFVFGKVFQKGRKMAPGLLNLFPGAKVLEVGVGTGLSLPCLPRNIELTGIDISQSMLDLATKRIESLGFNHVELLKMDATRLELPDNAYDRILAAYFISTVPDPVSVVHEMKRVCRPGGQLVFLNHFLNDQPFMAFIEKAISPLCYRIGFRTDLNLHQLLEQTGLKIETLEPIDFRGQWKAVRCINP